MFEESYADSYPDVMKLDTLLVSTMLTTKHWGFVAAIRKSLKAECGVLRRKVVEPSGEFKIVLDVEKNGIEKYDQFADDIEGSYRKLTENLQNWVKKVLDAPPNLNIPNLPPSSTTNTPTQPDTNTLDSQELDFDVLLNACKPTVSDSKLPIKVHIEDEANPPELLLNSLYDNLGIVIPKFRVSTAEARARGIPDYELARSRGEKLVKPGKNSKKIIQKAKYGVWYTHPSKWERNYQLQIESIRKNELSKK
ncbi:hypothetical protein HK098_007263 [Nowakowskiella sp. JEL0407]|nr:hypothetical protein HK098_007263 [Nowakowskiella sp. JEL0407]